MGKSNFRSEVVLFFIMSLLFFVSISAFDPFISVYAKEIGISPAAIGGIVGITGIAALLTRLPIGILSDLFLKRRLFIQLGLIITIICWTIAFISPNSTTLYIGKISDGLTGSTWVIYNVMFVAYFGRKEAAKAVAILAVASPASGLLATTVGGLVSNNFGYKYSFLVAVGAAVLALVLSFFLKEVKHKESNTKYDLKIIGEQISDKKLWSIGILAVGAMMVSFGNNTFIPLVAVDLGANPLVISALSIVNGILSGFAAALCAPFFYKKLGIVNTAFWGAVLLGIASIMVPYAPNLTALLILQGLVGFAMGMNFTVLTSLSIDNVEEIKQSTRLGLFQSIYSGGMFLGPVLMGILTDSFSRSMSFFVIGLIAFVGAVLTKVLIKHKNDTSYKKEKYPA